MLVDAAWTNTLKEVNKYLKTYSKSEQKQWVNKNGVDRKQ